MSARVGNRAWELQGLGTGRAVGRKLVSQPAALLLLVVCFYDEGQSPPVPQ